MFVLISPMLFGIGKSILSIWLMLENLMRKTFLVKLVPFKWMLKLSNFVKRRFMIYLLINWLGIASPLGLVLPSMFKKNAKIERGTPLLVINYKPLNKVLEWIRYPIPNKSDLVHRLSDAIIFSKFDMKSRFWQAQISEADKCKTTFTTPFGHYKWNVMPFGLKKAPSEF